MTLRTTSVESTRLAPAGDRASVRQTTSRGSGQTAIAWTALAFAALFQFFQLVPGPGGVDLSGYATALAAAAAVIAIPPSVASRRAKLSIEGRRREDALYTLLVWCLFLAWAAATTAMNRLDSRAVQHLSVYVLFVVGVSLASWTMSRDSAAWYLSMLGRLGILLSLVFLPATLIGGNASRAVYGPRSFALTALICLAAVVADPRTRTARRSIRRWTPYLIGAAIAASLSRTAAAVALLFLVIYFARRRPGRGALLRAVLALCVLSVLTVGAIRFIPAVHDRVLGGDRATVSGFRLNTEGRTVLWRIVEDQISTDPWLGHGTGAASDAIARAVPSLAQPHNDYLRILDDNGIIGLSIWALGFMLLAAGCLRRIRSAGPSDSGIHLAALLSLVAVALTMTTDNTIVYPFVMLPVAVLVGASLGQPVGRVRTIVDEPPPAMATLPNKSGR